MFLSVDPGINNFGLCVYDNQNNFSVIETKLVKGNRKFTEEEKLIEVKYGARVVKINSILEILKDIKSKYIIEGIVLEAPFYNALTPVAYGSLLEVITVVKYMFAYKYNLEFKLIEPLLVKKIFANKSLAAKDVIKQFLKQKKEDGSILLSTDIENLSEHEIDAIAVGFVHEAILKQQLT